jgi:hypothetical protein
MSYSSSQISNLIRTYPQQLRVKFAPQGDEAPLRSQAYVSERVSISPEGKRLLEAAATESLTTGAAT